ncbi:MAG: hypothetical protein JXB25_01455 [Deltaproteobacteria bacterium]|nr:hypothetical protein [Deltaproteobacteria bacterium]
MPKELLIASAAMAMFIVCPRMAGMVHVISRHSQVSLVATALLGSVLSIPLVVAIVLVFAKTGLWGALTFCVLTDFAAAYVMKEMSLQAGVETLIIALFVVLGVNLAPRIAGLFLR